MDRRRFLALFGMTGVGAAGGAALAPAGAPVVPVGADADPREEQPDDPKGGNHRIIWSVDATAPVASLTFDDGPDPEFTPDVLDILDRYDVKSTFFMMGWNATEHADLARAVTEAGHEIASHTWSHQNLAFATGEETREEIDRGAEAVERVTGVRPRWFRPPRGQLSGFSVRYATMRNTDSVMWSLTRGVRGEGTPEAVRRHVAKFLGPGDIVCLHDGLGRGTFEPDASFTADLRARRKVEVGALPSIIEDALDQGLQLGTVSDVLAVEARPEDRIQRGDVMALSSRQDDG